MISRDIKKDLTLDVKFLNISELLPHEEVYNDRVEPLISYLRSLGPKLVIPSIICNQGNIIIDGHHRYAALREFNLEKVPVTYIDYENENILTHHIETKRITKSQIINAAKNNDLLKPKSSLHCFFMNKKFIPLIVFSELTFIPR